MSFALPVHAAAPNRTSTACAVLATVAACVLTLLLPLRQYFPMDNLIAQILLQESTHWLLAAAILLYVRFGERLPLASIGLRRPTLSTLGWGLLAAFVMFSAYPVVQLLLEALGATGSTMKGLDLRTLPAWTVLLLALRAGVVEEIVFRGFLLERIASLSGRRWIGALLSLAVFVAVHAKGWSPGHLVFVVVAGGMLTALYLRRRDLTCNIVAHVATDMAGLLVLRLQSGG